MTKMQLLLLGVRFGSIVEPMRFPLALTAAPRWCPEQPEEQRHRGKAIKDEGQHAGHDRIFGDGRKQCDVEPSNCDQVHERDSTFRCIPGGRSRANNTDTGAGGSTPRA